MLEVTKGRLYKRLVSKLGVLVQQPDPLMVEVEVRSLDDLTLLLAHL